MTVLLNKDILFFYGITVDISEKVKSRDKLDTKKYTHMCIYIDTVHAPEIDSTPAVSALLVISYLKFFKS